MVDPERKMPFAMWRITIALLALPVIGVIALGPSVDEWTPLVMLLGVITTGLSWSIAALLLRHYGKWPWRRN